MADKVDSGTLLPFQDFTTINTLRCNCQGIKAPQLYARFAQLYFYKGSYGREELSTVATERLSWGVIATSVPNATNRLLSKERREIINVRGQSYVSRLPKYWPPHSARRVCPPPATKAGGGGSIFWKTWDIGLASYSNNLSTARSLRGVPTHIESLFYVHPHHSFV